MKNSVVKVLAVKDPAVDVYALPQYKVLADFKGEVQFDVTPWSSYQAKMTKALAGEEDYDVVMVAGHLWLGDLVEAGSLAPIEMLEEDIMPALRKECMYKDKTYLSPSFCDGHMVVYRKALLEKVLPSPWGAVITPQQYMEAAKQLAKQKNLEIAPLVLKAHPAEVFTDALPFLRMQGLDVYDFNTGRTNCESEEIINGLEAYCGLKKYAITGTDTYGNEEVAAAIREKKVAMGVTWSGQLGRIYQEDCLEREDLAFTTLSTAWNVTWSFAVNARSEKQETAGRLLRYLRSARIDKVAGAYSGAPVRQESYVLGQDEFPWYACQQQMIERAKPLPVMAQAADKHALFYAEIAQAFAGKKSPAAAMRAVAREISSLEKCGRR